MADLRKHCEVDAASGVVVVRVPVDAGSGSMAVEFFRDLHRELVDTGQLHVVIDFRGVQVVESSVLAELVSLDRRRSAEGGAVCLCGFTPVLRDTLRQTLLDSILSVHDDVESAIAAIVSSRSRGESK